MDYIFGSTLWPWPCCEPEEEGGMAGFGYELKKQSVYVCIRKHSAISQGITNASKTKGLSFSLFELLIIIDML